MNDTARERPLELHDAHVPTSAEVIEAMYDEYGPIHPASYDQVGAMQRVLREYARLRGESPAPQAIQQPPSGPPLFPHRRSLGWGNR